MGTPTNSTPPTLNKHSNIHPLQQTTLHIDDSSEHFINIPDKNPNHTRYIFQNLNGISSYNLYMGFSDFVGDCSDLAADYVGFCEHNLNLDYSTKNICMNALRHKYHSSKLIMSDSPVSTKTKFKPGGTGHYLQGNLLGKVESHERDRLGRWTCVNLQGKGGKISIYAAYQTPISVSNQANITFHTQQKVIFETERTNEEEVIDDRTPWKRFKKDFIKDVQEKMSKGHEVLIFANFNEDRTDKNSIINTLVEELHLTDTWREHNNNQKEISTYHRGTKRLDYCLASRNLARSVKNITFTNFEEIANSDHRGIVLDIDETAVFNKKPITEFHERQLFSNDRKQIQEYLLNLQNHLLENGAYRIMDELTSSSIFQQEKLERLDNTITDASISAEKKLKTRRRPWWSSKINKIRYQLRLLRNHHKRLKQGYTQSPRIQLQLESNNMHVTLETTITASSIRIQEMNQQLTDLVKSAREIREREQLDRFDYLNRNGMKSKAAVNKLIRQKERLADAFRQVKNI